MAIAVLVPTIGRGPQFTTDQYMRARHPIGISDPAIGRLHIARVTDARPSPADRPAIPDHPETAGAGHRAISDHPETAGVGHRAISDHPVAVMVGRPAMFAHRITVDGRPAILDHPVAVMVGLLATLGRQERAQGLPEMAAVLLDPRPHPDPLRFSDLRRRQDQLQFSGPRPR
jgi:hypothetical protein